MSGVYGVCLCMCRGSCKCVWCVNRCAFMGVSGYGTHVCMCVYEMCVCVYMYMCVCEWYVMCVWCCVCVCVEDS